MPKGLIEHKHRNANRRTSRAQRLAVVATFAASHTEIKRLYREDLRTGEITETSRSKFEREIDWYLVFSRWHNYSGASSIVWDEMTRGALFFTRDAMFRIEKVPAAHKAVELPEPIYVNDCENVCLFCGSRFISGIPEADCGACSGAEQVWTEAA